MLTIVIVVGLSLLIGVGFGYMGYTSGHFSKAYGLCKDNILSHETTAALRSCDGVTS